MLNHTELRKILKNIFRVEDKYLVPLNQDWFIPTVDKNDKTGTWIGYRILDKKGLGRAYQEGVYFIRPFKLRLRLAFVGPQAEELADSTMFWEDRTDVENAFAKASAQLFYNDRTQFSYPIRNSGYNDMEAWIVDMAAQSTIIIDTKQAPWLPRRGE